MTDTQPVTKKSGWAPVPDPTKLTTDAVNLATAQSRRELASLREIIEARILAGEESAGLRLESIRGVRSEIERQIAQLEKLHDERFSSIALQFRERDVRTEQAASASKQALDAALLAAKELVGQQNTANVEAAAKAEASFTKQIDQIGVIISTLEKAITDRILELKERIDRGEGQGQATTAARVELREDTRTQTQTNGFYISAAAAFISVAAILVTVILALRR